jgi:hypothetical protein
MFCLKSMLREVKMPCSWTKSHRTGTARKRYVLALDIGYESLRCARAKNSTPRGRLSCWRRVAPWQTTPYEGWALAAPATCKVLTILFSLALSRAYGRIVQQRKDAVMPLGRVIDIRKRVFADVKVRFTTIKKGAITNDARRLSPIWAPKLATQDLCPLCALPPTAKSSPPAAGPAT